MRKSILVLFVFLIAAGVTRAEIPQEISYQGKVTDTSGIPVPDGSYIMRFRIYNAASGGSVLWDSGNQSVSLTGGIFDVNLGGDIAPPITLDFTQDYWLLVTFDGVNQFPRQQLTSASYAYMASGLVPGTEVIGSVTTGTDAVFKATNTALSSTVYGVHGECASTSGFGVYGTATASTGYAYGGLFESQSSDGRALGAWAVSSTGNTYGLYALVSSLSGRAVYGSAQPTVGYSIGVWGNNNSTDGGFGVYYSGGLAGSGSKSCVVRTSQGPTLLYCQESTECWFEDFGRGQLVNGRARIELSPLFLETVTVDDIHPMNVFIQLLDDCKGTFVRTNATGFEVNEVEDGTSNARFAYRVVAKRKGFEAKRLDYCKVAESDTCLYPELREKEGMEAKFEGARMSGNQ